MLKLVKENRGVVMINFFSGFIAPEGARAMQKMFEVMRDLKKKYADDETKYREAIRAWVKENDYPAGDVRLVIRGDDRVLFDRPVDRRLDERRSQSRSHDRLARGRRGSGAGVRRL